MQPLGSNCCVWCLSRAYQLPGLCHGRASAGLRFTVPPVAGPDPPPPHCMTCTPGSPLPCWLQERHWGLDALLCSSCWLCAGSPWGKCCPPSAVTCRTCTPAVTGVACSGHSLAVSNREWRHEQLQPSHRTDSPGTLLHASQRLLLQLRILCSAQPFWLR